VPIVTQSPAGAARPACRLLTGVAAVAFSVITAQTARMTIGKRMEVSRKYYE